MNHRQILEEVRDMFRDLDDDRVEKRIGLIPVRLRRLRFGRWVLESRAHWDTKWRRSWRSAEALAEYIIQSGGIWDGKESERSCDGRRVWDRERCRWVLT